MHEFGLYVSKEHGNLLIVRDKGPGIKLPKDVVFDENDPFLLDVCKKYDVSVKALVGFLVEATKE